MSGTAERNPYSAPQSLRGESDDSTRSAPVNWILWIGATALTVSVLTTTWIIINKPPAHCAEMYGVLLVGSTLLIAVRRNFSSALRLTQAMNVTTWLTMLITVWLVLPMKFPGAKLHSSDYEIFGMIWLAGVAGGAVIVCCTKCLQHVFRDIGKSTSPPQ